MLVINASTFDKDVKRSSLGFGIVHNRVTFRMGFSEAWEAEGGCSQPCCPHAALPHCSPSECSCVPWDAFLLGFSRQQMMARA